MTNASRDVKSQEWDSLINCRQGDKGDRDLSVWSRFPFISKKGSV